MITNIKQLRKRAKNGNFVLLSIKQEMDVFTQEGIVESSAAHFMYNVSVLVSVIIDT